MYFLDWTLYKMTLINDIVAFLSGPTAEYTGFSSVSAGLCTFEPRRSAYL